MTRNTSYHTLVKKLPHSFLRLDLHGMNRWTARKQLLNYLFRLLAQNKNFLLAIHGYRRGTVLRDYIRQGGLVRDLRRQFPLFPSIKIEEVHDGATRIRIAEVAA